MSTSGRTNERVAGLSLSMASLGGRTAAVWEPNWIDYRSSLANVDRREDRGDTAETCHDCDCETDITPAPHSPKCQTLRPDPEEEETMDGRALLDRMDAGEPLTDDEDETGLAEEEQAPTGLPERSVTEEVDAAAPAGRAAHVGEASSNGRTPRGQLQLAVLREIVAGRHTAPLIGGALGRAPKAVSVVLLKLRGKGLVEKVAYGRYSATDAGREAAAGGAPLDAKSSGREPSAARRDGVEAAADDATVTGDEETPRGTSDPSRPDSSLATSAGEENLALALRDPIRTAEIPYDADVLEDEAAFLRGRAAALEQIAGGIRELARLSTRDAA